jgi:hypothetical protein
MSDETKRKDRPGDQPMPVEGRGPWIQDLVLKDLVAQLGDSVRAAFLMDEVERRKALGLSRYGTLLQAFNGRDALQDAMDEAVDLIIYLRQALVEAAERRDEGLRSELASAYHDVLCAGKRLAWIRSLRPGYHGEGDLADFDPGTGRSSADDWLK